jgi:hypothetical protein
MATNKKDMFAEVGITSVVSSENQCPPSPSVKLNKLSLSTCIQVRSQDVSHKPANDFATNLLRFAWPLSLDGAPPRLKQRYSSAESRTSSRVQSHGEFKKSDGMASELVYRVENWSKSSGTMAGAFPRFPPGPVWAGKRPQINDYRSLHWSTLVTANSVCHVSRTTF